MARTNLILLHSGIVHHAACLFAGFFSGVAGILGEERKLRGGLLRKKSQLKQSLIKRPHNY